MFEFEDTLFKNFSIINNLLFFLIFKKFFAKIVDSFWSFLWIMITFRVWLSFNEKSNPELFEAKYD